MSNESVFKMLIPLLMLHFFYSRLTVIEAKKPALNMGPSLPPPPPPPPPPPGLLTSKPIIFTASKKTPVAATTPRPSVTVQDLLSVRLRKVQKTLPVPANKN